MTELDQIKKFAKERGLSLQTVAEKAGMGINSIYRWKTQTPRLDKLQDVADVLGVKLSDLTGDGPEKDEGKKSKVDLLAAHLDDDVSDDDMEEIATFIEYIKHKNKKR